ncbi:serine/threonine protein kinase [Dictyobacter formicarum]|uniref:non-specific serine/threonine protein kinase n=1 Tax=Dictyobacter formicarum TaxID=2778368 RepID=A0ABQ3VB70_9CHLR|nr:serine/threonine-protein kinase [Dictyobacter formicarum]GHO82941.1 hypothetical protein KSZ_09470 [Dictyobacter formicarum]
MVTDSNELLGQALGTCTLQRLLGRGGMGAVYLARQSRPRRIVAVKVLLPGIVLEQRPRNEFLARFRREADAVAALDHVNIMPVYEYGEQGDLAYLVMPYVTGGTLREVLEKRGILSLEEVVPIIEQAAAGLDSAHAQSIVHRDLKPGNILFHADGRVLLADFGLAKVLKDVTNQESTNGHLTSIGTIVGTPEYLSPEQSTGDTIDYRTDVYSLGVVLYQMLAGRVPFTGTSPVAVAIKHTLEQAPPITRFNPQVPKNVEAVVMKAMAKSPNDRFSSAGVFAQALRQAVAEALGDCFPSVAPPALGEHITPVLLPPLTPENNAETPLEPATNNDELPAEAMKHTADKEETPNQAMSTMLMENEEEDAEATEPTKVTPRLSEHTQNRLQAMPTVITEMDATIADHARPEPLAVPLANSPVRSVTPTTNPPAARNYQEVEPAARQSEVASEQPRQQQSEQAARQPQIQVYPERFPRTSHRQAGATMPRYLVLSGAVLAVILVIAIASVIISNQQGNSPQSKPPGIAQSPSAATRTATPAPGKSTPPGSTVHATYPLPAPKVDGMGNLIYGTNYPGTCDPQGGKWQNTNIQAVCGPDELRLSNPGSGVAGTFLTQLPNGQTLPDNYYIQAQVKINTPGGQFGFYYHNKSDSYYTVMFSSSTWTANYTDKNGTQNQLASIGLNGTQLDGTATIDILVQGSTFYYYINGVKQGTASGNFGDSNSGGNIGLTVAPGSDVSFKNVAIYSA